MIPLAIRLSVKHAHGPLALHDAVTHSAWSTLGYSPDRLKCTQIPCVQLQATNECWLMPCKMLHLCTSHKPDQTAEPCNSELMCFMFHASRERQQRCRQVIMDKLLQNSIEARKQHTSTHSFTANCILSGIFHCTTSVLSLVFLLHRKADLLGQQQLPTCFSALLQLLLQQCDSFEHWPVHLQLWQAVLKSKPPLLGLPAVDKHESVKSGMCPSLTRHAKAYHTRKEGCMAQKCKTWCLDRLLLQTG